MLERSRTAVIKSGTGAGEALEQSGGNSSRLATLADCADCRGQGANRLLSISGDIR
jgi:hypothetical protein